MDVTRGCTPFWQPNPNQPTHPTSSVVQIENRIGTYRIISFLYYISLPDWMYIRGGSGLFVGVFRVLRPDWVPTSTTCMSANPENCPQCTCTNIFCSTSCSTRARACTMVHKRFLVLTGAGAPMHYNYHNYYNKSRKCHSALPPSSPLIRT